MAQADYVNNAFRALITGATQNRPQTQSGRRMPSSSPPWQATPRGQSRSPRTLSTLRNAQST